MVSNTYCVVVLFCFLRLVYPMLPFSLDCPFFIAPSVVSLTFIFSCLGLFFWNVDIYFTIVGLSFCSYVSCALVCL